MLLPLSIGEADAKARNIVGEIAQHCRELGTILQRHCGEEPATLRVYRQMSRMEHSKGRREEREEQPQHLLVTTEGHDHDPLLVSDDGGQRPMSCVSTMLRSQKQCEGAVRWGRTGAHAVSRVQENNG